MSDGPAERGGSGSESPHTGAGDRGDNQGSTGIEEVTGDPQGAQGNGNEQATEREGPGSSESSASQAGDGSDIDPGFEEKGFGDGSDIDPGFEEKGFGDGSDIDPGFEEKGFGDGSDIDPGFED
ncbi:hypothetical protein ABZX90_38235, partial [Streptomyces sp. NPDC002935]